MALGNNVLSDGDLYLNFDNSGGGGGAGALKLDVVESLDDTSDRKRENVVVMGVKGARGTRRTKGGGSLSLDCFIEEGLPQVSWLKLDENDVIFSLRYVPNGGGPAITWFGCEVSTVGPKLNASGDNKFTVEITYKRRKG